MIKYLDANGVKVLWKKISADFLPTSTELITEDKVQDLVEEKITSIPKEEEIKTWISETTSTLEEKITKKADVIPEAGKAEVNGEICESLSEAFAVIDTKATITLVKDETISEHIYIRNGAKIYLDLNGHTLTEEGCSIIVVKGELTIDNGLIYHTGDSNQALKVVASVEPVTNNAVLNLKPNLRIFCPDDYGVFISPQATNSEEKGNYGAIINCDCEIRSKYVPLYLNGFILDKGQVSCAINVGKSAKLIATGLSGDMTVGLYGAGYGDYNISDGAQIEGLTGIEIRAGNLTINGGIIHSIGGTAKTQKNGNGNASRGAAVALIPHTSKQPITAVINSGYFKAAIPFIEENTEENENPEVLVEIKDGIFEMTLGSDGDSVYAQDLTKFITGGTFIPSANEKYIKEEA